MQMLVLPNGTDPVEIGQKIRKRRKELHLSQDKLADRMGTSRNDVYRHEHGEHEMGICTLFQYAEALETDPRNLCPDRFRQEEVDSRLYPLIGRLGRLSDESLQQLLGMADLLIRKES